LAEEIESLENKPYFEISQARLLIDGQMGHVLATKAVFSRRRCIQEAEDIH
jgi:hypothetical protein